MSRGHRKARAHSNGNFRTPQFRQRISGYAQEVLRSHSSLHGEDAAFFADALRLGRERGSGELTSIVKSEFVLTSSGNPMPASKAIALTYTNAFAPPEPPLPVTSPQSSPLQASLPGNPPYECITSTTSLPASASDLISEAMSATSSSHENVQGPSALLEGSERHRALQPSLIRRSVKS